MNHLINKYQFFILLPLLLLCGETATEQEKDALFLSYVSDPAAITFYWKDSNGKILGSIQNLKTFVEADKRELTFAMNGGMYKKDNSPQGLFIENSETLSPLDTLSGMVTFT
jgi:uncharacterized protein YigE (DUF2233 family)